MTFEFKDPLIVSALFLVLSSDWFSNWIKDLFPSLATSDPLVFTLMKTGLFALGYWLYKKADLK